jgi:hypothetical protein
MKSAGITFFLFFIAAFYQPVNCQVAFEEEVVTDFQDFSIQERALVITDQDIYLAGETINVFAITYDQALQMPIDLSSVLYVELFNQNNQVVNAQKYLLENGQVVNRLTIPKELETGYYYIRAYTNYMKNLGASSFFMQRLRIINPFVSSNDQHDRFVKPEKSTLKVFAEGGKIISGIENKIVVRYTNGDAPLHAILYEDHAVINEINTNEGFGVFNFTPSVHHHYRIDATWGSNEKTTIELNEMVQTGVVCKLDSVNQNSAFIKINSWEFDQFPLSILIQNNGMRFQQMKFKCYSDTSLTIKLPSGLNEITLKDNENRKVSERAIYIGQKNNIEVTTQLNNSSMHPGDTLTLRINGESTDSIRYLVALNLDNANHLNSFRSQMDMAFFSSSVASRIKPMTFHVSPQICSNPQKINDFLLTFQFNEKLKPINNILYLPEIKGDIITGSAMLKDSQIPAVNKDIYISFVDSICWVNRCKTDSLGHFTCKLPLQYQGEELVVSVPDTTQKYSFSLDDEFYAGFLEVEKETYFPDPSLKEMIETRMVHLQINDVFRPKYSPELTKRSDLRFYGTPNVEYLFRKYVNLPNLEEFIYEIAIEAVKVRNGDKIDFKIRTQSKTGNEPSLILFDGVPLFKTDQLAAIPSVKLESIRMVTQKFYLGSAIYNGIIDITSVDKSLDLVDLAENSKRIIFPKLITSKPNRLFTNDRSPIYMSDLYFDVINSKLDHTELKIKMPQNTGYYSLQLLGFKKSGAWGVISQPNIMKVTP